MLVNILRTGRLIKKDSSQISNDSEMVERLLHSFSLHFEPSKAPVIAEDLIIQPSLEHRVLRLYGTDECWRRAVPLANLNGSNVCFANAVVQMLTFLTSFVFLVKNQLDCFAGQDVGEIKDLVNKLLDGQNDAEGYFCLDGPIMQKWTKKRSNRAQEDVGEFLMFVLGELAERTFVGYQAPLDEGFFNLVGKRGQKVKTVAQAATLRPKIAVSDGLFSGALMHTTSGEVVQLRERTEPFYILTLPVTATRLEDMIDRFCSLNGGLTNNGVTITTTLDILPPVLFIQIQRCKFDLTSQMLVKDHRAIKVPENLVIQRRWLSRRAQEQWTEDDLLKHDYELMALVNHIGETPIAGHYLAVGRRQNIWIQADDTNITETADYKSGSSPQSCYLVAYEMKNILPMSPIVPGLLEARWYPYLRN